MTTTEAPTTTVHAAPAAAATPERTLSIISLVIGVASLVFGQTLVVPAVGIVLGFLGHRREPEGRVFATWGIVLGFVAIFGWILLGILGAAVLAPFLIFAAI